MNSRILTRFATLRKTSWIQTIVAAVRGGKVLLDAEKSLKVEKGFQKSSLNRTNRASRDTSKIRILKKPFMALSMISWKSCEKPRKCGKKRLLRGKGLKGKSV